tara:strand:- start:509 stop:898 length:390 start_codon:yes stop_codon:yes gene_type:complete
MKKKYLAKIIALDINGLSTISAIVSGAKVLIADIKYLPSSKVFLLSIERTKIESEQKNKTINSIIRLDFVQKVRSKNIDQSNKDLVLELIAIDYLKNNEDYEINLIFNNNAFIALTVETIEARLEDQTE